MAVVRSVFPVYDNTGTKVSSGLTISSLKIIPINGTPATTTVSSGFTVSTSAAPTTVIVNSSQSITIFSDQNGNYIFGADPEVNDDCIYVWTLGGFVAAGSGNIISVLVTKEASRIILALPNVAPGASGGLPTGDASGRVTLVPTDSTIQRTGTAQAGASTTITLDSGASATDNFYRDSVISIKSGTGAGQGSRVINGYVGSTKVATVHRAWITTPDNTSVFKISDSLSPSLDSSSQVNSTLTAASIQSVWDALTSALTTSGSIGKLFVDNLNATISSRMASGNVTIAGYAGGQDPATLVAAMVVDTTGTPITMKQALALAFSILGNHYTATAITAHHKTVTFYKNDGTTVICTEDITYDATDSYITDRAKTFSNLP